MKRFVSILLVAMLLMSSLATVAFAADEPAAEVGSISAGGVTKYAKAGETVNLSFSVGGSYAGYTAQVTVNSPLVSAGLSISSGDANPANGMVAFSSANNVNSTSVSVSVTVPAGTPAGTYSVNLSILSAYDAAWNKLGNPVATCYVVVEETPCDHEYGDWIIDKDSTCKEEGSKHRVCKHCEHVDTAVIGKKAHSYGSWITDEKGGCTEDGSKHRVCSVCGHKETAVIGATGHSWGEILYKAPTENEQGYYYKVCKNCGEIDIISYVDPDMDPMPPTGDITPMLMLFALICIGGVSLIFVKRRTVQ